MSTSIKITTADIFLCSAITQKAITSCFVYLKSIKKSLEIMKGEWGFFELIMGQICAILSQKVMNFGVLSKIFVQFIN